jgi:hypothetical protein
VQYRKTLVFLAVLLMCAGVCAGPVICARCGYENGGTGKECSHCGAELAEPKAPPGDAAPDDPAGAQTNTGAALIAGFVREEVKQGIAWLERGEVEMARLFFHNAAALNPVTGADGADQRSGEIVALLGRCEAAPAVRMRRECAVCGGAGKIKAEAPAQAGGPSRLGPPAKTCSVCGGAGQTEWRGTMDDRKFARGRALQQYGTLQQARKLVPLGGAWLPAEAASGLSAGQRVQVKRAAASSCAECLGFGRVDCRKCRGLGRIDCPERDCVKGLVTVEDGSGLTQSKLRQTRKCPDCGGNGYVSCRDCAGQGGILCAECSGTGRREACRRCGGEGLGPCRRCSGSGVQKDASCAACLGARIVECAACNGDGKRK